MPLTWSPGEEIEQVTEADRCVREKKRKVKQRRTIKQLSFSIAAMLFDPFFFFFVFDKQSIVETSHLLFSLEALNH